jgi:hypothetical protein
MMATTVRRAVDLLFLPGQAKLIRFDPLPDDVSVLLRIAAGDGEATRQAAISVRQSCEVVRKAAAFFIEQALLFPGADSYRVLGVRPEAPSGELRRNMTLLLRWLHPDLDPMGERSVFAARVTAAWNDLKTPERRAAYDRLRRMSAVEKTLLRKKATPRKKQRSNLQHPHNNRQYSRHAIFHRSVANYPHKRRGFVPQILMMLFRRFAHW